MISRKLHISCAVVFLLVTATFTARASERRMTPIVRAIQHAQKSAVNIHSEKTAQADALFAPGKSRKVNGMGTGIIVDERGYIVTNHHVVKDVDALRCTLADGSTYSARIISYDRQKDLAIIKIDPTRSLPVMPLGTSSDLMLGETVIALGNPYGYENTVTCGIVSSLSRDVEVNETQSYSNLIQTDASINPGNSGGPLINLDGEVIGINVAIRAGAQRIGFAIPIDDARNIIARLISIENLDGHWHGLVTRDLKAGEQRSLQVLGSRDSSPAAQAGFQKGDIIKRAADREIVDLVDLERVLLGREAGDKIPVTVIREGKEQTISIAIAPRRGVRGINSPRFDVVARRNLTPAENDRSWDVLGLRLARTNLAAGDRNSSRYNGGMKVTDVRPGSPAERNGIRRGDVLIGLHIWETLNEENVSFVLDHPKLNTFNPLKFYILRGKEPLYGFLQLASQQQ